MSDFDVNKFRLDSHDADVCVEKLPPRISARRPGPTVFFRIHHGGDWQLPAAAILEDPGEDPCIVLPDLARTYPLMDVVKPALLRVGITRTGDLFVVHVKLPRDGKSNSWNDSLMKAMQDAERKWVRIVSSRAQGQYLTETASGQLPEPEWPQDLTFSEVIRRAFEGRLITSIDDIRVKKLRGDL